jgi:hypothetical protein
MATVKKIGTELNWELEKNATWGTFKGFQVSLVQQIDLMGRQPAYKSLVVSFDEITQEKAQELIEFVNENKKVLRVTNFKISTTFISIFINEGFKGLTSESLMEVLDQLIIGFTKLEVYPSSKCIYCNLETTEEVVVNKVKIRAHVACYEQATEELIEEKKDINYTSGIIGASLGALLGILPFIIVFIIGWILPLLMTIVGFATFFGYKLVKAEFTEKAKWIISITSAVFILLALLFAAGLVSFFSGITLIEVFQDPELDFTYYGGFSLLWGLIGISSAYRLAKNKEY